MHLCSLLIAIMHKASSWCIFFLHRQNSQKCNNNFISFFGQIANIPRLLKIIQPISTKVTLRVYNASWSTKKNGTVLAIIRWMLKFLIRSVFSSSHINRKFYWKTSIKLRKINEYFCEQCGQLAISLSFYLSYGRNQ